MASPEDGGLRFDDRMSDLEALLWHMEEHQPWLRSPITVVATFDRAADPAAVADRVDRLSRLLPRFRDRVAVGALPMAPPRWEPDPEFRLDRHLLRVRAEEPGSLAELLHLAEAVAARPFAPDHPPWEIVLVLGSDNAPHERSARGRAGPGGPGPDVCIGLIVKLHHTFTDGIGAVRLAAKLFDLERHPVPDDMPPEPGEAVRRPGVSRMWDDLAFEAGRTAGIARRVLPWAAAGMRDAVLDPGDRARASLELAHSLRTLVRVAGRSPDPVLSGRSAGAHLGAVTLPIADLRATAQRAQGTINDVFLAAALGALRLYQAKRGFHPPSVRVGVPLSTRKGGDEGEMRNQFAPMVVRAPLQLLDPVERIRLVHELVIAARQEPALDLLEHATGMLRRAPGATRLIAGLMSAADLVVSNVPGSPVDLYLGGAQVQRLIPIGPRAGTGLNLTLISHVDAVHVGVNMDPASIPDSGVFVDCLRAGFDETLG
jgi:diacylglycerol O-acyltransferase